MRRLLLAALLTSAALPVASAHAVPAAGVTASRYLVLFDTDSPGTFSYRPITGLQANERIIGLDARPANGQLHMLGAVDPPADANPDTLRQYTLDPATAVATQLGNPIGGGADDASYGSDFNPAADRLRVVNTSDQNFRLNPNDGSLAGTDTNLDNPASVESVVAVAYDRNLPVAPGAPGTPTTLFAIDESSSDLMRIGGVDGTPSPNGGVLTKLADLSQTLTSGATADMDIDSSGTAWAALPVADGDHLYRLNLANGTLTDAGKLFEGLVGFTIRAPVPLHFDSTAVTVSEGAGSIDLPVSRLGTVTAINANWTTVPGSASGLDYETKSGTVAFAANDSTPKTLSIMITQDTADEPDETFTVVLSKADGTPVLSPNAVTVTITDDDEPATQQQPPTQQPPPPVVDVTAPVASLGAAASIRLAALLKRGLTVTVTCDEACSGPLRLKIGRTTIASRTLRAAAGKRSVRLTPTRRQKAALRRLLRGRSARSATLSATLFDAAKNATTKTRKVRVRRR